MGPEMGLKRKENINMTKNSLKVKRLVGLAILTALTIVLQMLGNFIPNFANNLALALIPIAVGAILYGPLAGLYLGAVMSATVACNPANYSLMATGLDTFKLLIVMFVKSPVAGLLAGYAYKGLAILANKFEGAKKNTMFFVAVLLTSLVVPVVNTGMYAIGMLFLFGALGSDSFSLSMLVNNAEATGGSAYGSAVAVVFVYWIGVNFFIEAGVSVLAAAPIVTVLKAVTRNYNLGYDNDFSDFNGVAEEEKELADTLNAESADTAVVAE